MSYYMYPGLMICVLCASGVGQDSDISVCKQHTSEVEKGQATPAAANIPNGALADMLCLAQCAGADADRMAECQRGLVTFLLLHMPRFSLSLCSVSPREER
jgi:hypothetical protein